MHICPSGHQSKMATNYNYLEKGQRRHKGKLHNGFEICLNIYLGACSLSFSIESHVLWTNWLQPPPKQSLIFKSLSPVWWCWEMGFLIGNQVMRVKPGDGISDLEEEIRDSWHPLSTLYMWGYKDKALICKPRMRFSPDARPACSLILDFLSSRNVRNVSYLFNQSSLW